VLLLEQKDRIGKKLLATGNGKCNFTNEHMELSAFHGDLELVKAVLSQFSKDDTLAFFHALGILPKNKNEYYYPASEQASSVVHAFSRAIAHDDNITLRTSSKISQIRKECDFFTVMTEDHRKEKGKAIILASGLLAAPKLGSDGFLFAAVKELGHRFSPIVPALCGFYCKGADFKRISGVRVAARVTVLIDGDAAASDTGELQLTDYGISGIPVFQISRFASLALYEKKRVEAELCFLPDLTDEALLGELQYIRTQLGADASISEVLNGLLPAKLAAELEKRCAGDFHLLLTSLRHFRVTVERARDFEFAQVCAGGIRSEEIDRETLASRFVPGLFFAGELLDVDGICGGYNLQWAWASGYVAGKSAAEWKQK
jgi:predicted Rossmann fold flavoprotein